MWLAFTWVTNVYVDEYPSYKYHAFREAQQARHHVNHAFESALSHMMG